MSHIDEGQIHAYLDRQLEFQDPLARERFEAHMAECSECAAQLDEARSIHERAAQVLGVGVPEAVDVPSFDQVVSRAGKHTARTARVRQLVRTRNLAWAASIVVAVAVGWYARVSTSAPRAEDTVEEAPSTEARMADESVRTGAAAESPGRVPPAAPAAATDPDAAAGPQREAGRRSQAEAELQEVAQEQRLARGRGADVPAERQQADELASKAADQPVSDSVRRDVVARAQRARELADEAVPVAADAFAFGNEAAWTAISRDDAAAILGRPVASVDGLDIVEISASGAQAGTVRVVQRLPSGDSLEVLQRRTAPELDQVAGVVQMRAAEAAARRREDAVARRRAEPEARPEDAPGEAATSSLMVTWENLRIEVRGRVSGDSLQVLLSRLREAPGSN